MDQLLKIALGHWEIAKQLGAIPLVSIPVNFIISFFSARFFVVFYSHKDSKEYIHFMVEVENMGKNRKKIYKKYVWSYSCITGILSAMVIHHQFQVVRIFYATIYGLLGPYALKDKMLKHFSSDLFKSPVEDKEKDLEKEEKKYTKEVEAEVRDSIREMLNMSKDNDKDDNLES